MTDISGLDKTKLLHALWSNQRPAGFFGSGPGPTFDHAQAAHAIKRGDIDYFQGRAIKADLRGETVDFTLYDRDADKSGAEVVRTMRGGSRSGDKTAKSAAANQGCEFEPWGEPMLPDKPHTVMCAKCGFWKSQH